ncbi:GTPase [Iodobacter sp.]|uniref:GTPase n=1 Tax=Iodobacter sp. TaxID=1915058 RepID=UPI0025F80AB1|nr:GTPase [Iodobacter sp.]
MAPFQLLLDNLEKSKSIISKYIDNSALLTNELRQSIEIRKLQIMLYGAYNAGKSSLINTLLAKNEAIVNDIPTTDKIDQYNWNGFYLLDTPGVNAPISHEEVTAEQVKRTNAMLFVLREGDHDSKDIYERLFSMLKKGKKIFIVLNHQLASQDDKLTALKRINSILCSLAPKYNTTDEEIAHITVLPMNIKTAFNARLKSHEKLLEHSGYNFFIQSFNDWVIVQDQENNKLAALKNHIDECWYQPVISQIKTKLNQTESLEIRHLRDDRLMLEAEKTALKIQSSQYIIQQVNLLKPEVSNTLQNTNSQTSAESELQAIFATMVPKTESWLNDEVGKVNNKLSIPIQHKNNHLYNVINKENAILDTVVHGAKDALNEENLKNAFLLGRELKIPMLKGRWDKTLGNWAGKAAIAVQVLTFFYDIYKANADQDRKNKEQHERTVQLYQAVEQICTSVISDMTSNVHGIITLNFDKKIKGIQQKLELISKEDSDIKKDYSLLNQLKTEMADISF